MRHRLGVRDGFTIVEVLVALAITALLGALVVPAILASVDRARIDAAEKSLKAIAEGVNLFADRVQVYPSSMTQLLIPITTADADICGTLYSAGRAGQWGGPYLDRAVPAAGVPIGIGTVQNAFTSLPDPSGIDYLQVVVNGVLLEDAAGLDGRMDGGDGAAAGAVRWTVTGGGFVSVRYLIPYRDC
jgi:prepilin-type N-terminal cleavage/methylation domain-containing protein